MKSLKITAFVLMCAGTLALTACDSGGGSSSWTRLSGVSEENTYADAISTDSDGNVYVTGSTYGALDGETLNGTADAFVIKYNSSGVKQWTRLSGVSGTYTYGYGISTDTGGNVYVAGYTDGALDGQTLHGDPDVFVIKYNSSGVKQWTRLSGVSGTFTYGYGLSTDTGGNVYVAGYTGGALDGETRTGTIDAFVIRYNSSGVKQWTELSGVSGSYTYGYGISTDPDSNVYVAGDTYGNLDGETRTGTRDAFVIKYNSSGVKQWTELSGAPVKTTWAHGISTDTGGNVYIAGYTTGALNGESLTGTKDAFVIKYYSSGNIQWTRLSGVSGKDTDGQGISTDQDGNVYVTGYTEGDLDGQTLTGTKDAFVIRYNSSGVKRSTKLSGVSGKDTDGQGISTDPDGIVYVAGYTDGDLDGQSLTGTIDAFVTTGFN